MASNDVSTLLGLERPINAEYLRALFFPTTHEASARTLKGDLRLTETYTDGAELPKLEAPITVDRQSFDTRRPDFLKDLPEAKYKEVFLKLTGPLANEKPSTWDRLSKAGSQSVPQVKKIMRHVLLWLNPNWRPIPDNSPRQQLYTFCEDISAVYHGRPVSLTEDENVEGTGPWPFTSEDNKIGRKTTTAVWRSLLDHPGWKNADKQVSP